MHSRPVFRRFKLTDVLSYGFSVLVLVSLVVWAGKGGLQRLSSPHPIPLVISFLLTFFFVELMALRYAAALSWIHRGKIPGHWSVLYGTAFGMTTGLYLSKGLGQVLGKPAILKEQNSFPLTKGIYASLLERIGDLMQSVVLAVPLIARWYLGQDVSVNTALVIYFCLSAWLLLAQTMTLSGLVTRIHGLLLWIIARLGRDSWRWLKRLKEQMDGIHAVLSEGRTSLGPRAAFVGWSLLKVYVMAARMFFLSIAFSVPISWEVLLLGVPVVQLGLAFGITPGALGFLEASWFAVLAAQGVQGDAIVTLLLALRVTNFVFYPLISQGMLLLGRWSGRALGRGEAHS